MGNTATAVLPPGMLMPHTMMAAAAVVGPAVGMGSDYFGGDQTVPESVQVADDFTNDKD